MCQSLRANPRNVLHVGHGADQEQVQSTVRVGDRQLDAQFRYYKWNVDVARFDLQTVLESDVRLVSYVEFWLV